MFRLFVLSIIQITFSKEARWLYDLKNYISIDLNVHQVIFPVVGDQTHMNSRMEAVIRTVSNKLPNKKIYFSIDDANDHIPELESENPTTSLFIVISSQEDLVLSLLNKPINFISNLSPSRSRPKCLIILSEKVSYHNYEKLLRFMWFSDFLDVTVITLSTTRSEQDHFLLNQPQYSARIHYFNPHTDTIKVERYRSGIQWFPDKVSDLKGHEIKVATRHSPPYVIAKCDRVGCKDITGLGLLKMNALSKFMNFKMIIENYKSLGRLDCRTKYNSTGIYRSLILKKVEFVASEFGRFASCDDKFYEWSKGITQKKICLVVPVLPIKSYSLTAGWKILNLFAVISLPLIVWIFVRFFHFDNQYWRFAYLVQMVISSVVPREPQRLAERIMFACILVTCLLYSSLIFTVFTDIGFEIKKSFELESVEDVVSSSFKTVIKKNLLKFIYNDNNDIQRRLLEKVVTVNKSYLPCIAQLTLNRNVVCALFSLEAKYVLQNKRDKCSLPIAKILSNECLSKTWSGTVLAARSPYVRRVNDILQRLIEAGVTEKWKSMYSVNTEPRATIEFSCINKTKESMQLLNQMFFVLLFGYSFSILTFFVELLLVWRLKHKAKDFKISRQLDRR